MSENKHTPEPWIYQEDSDAYTHIIRQKADQRMIIAYGPQSSKGNVEHNIRRIVACVNACAGIPTDQLESGEARYVRNELADIYALEKRRDELLAALVHIQQVACSGSPELGIASEAIASVKGGTANTAADGWIEWKGGACPVDGETIVQCKLREPEGANMKERKAKEWSWKHCSDFNKYDIIAYRVVKGGAA